MSPAYFGLVMATGIVSLAAQQRSLPRLAAALFVLNVGAYAVLWALTLLRLARHRGRFFDDLVDHLRGPGFFTAVAASSVLGAQCVALAGAVHVAMALLAVAVVLWLLLTYAIFAALTIKRRKPSLADGISGAWLLAVVAAQSIAVLGATVADHVPQPQRMELNFLALSLWLFGGMLYIWMMSLIFYRYTFFEFVPGDLSPPYWINMGAMAISALAGSLLVGNAHDAPFLESLLPFLKGFAVLYWATGTWWIPMLVVLTAWRYLVHGYPVHYSPAYWAAVFPLGMYAVSTQALAGALSLHFLDDVPPTFFGVAALAWLMASVGLVRDLVGHLRAR